MGYNNSEGATLRLSETVQREQIFASETPAVSEAPDALESLMRARYSCRAFLQDEVPQHLIERMLEIAQLSPSWCNTQPWQVEITSGAATERLRQALRAHLEEQGHYSDPDYSMPVEYTGVHRERRRVSGWQLYDAVGIAKGDREASARQGAQNLEFFGAPHVAVVTVAKELATYGAVDAGIYVGALMLAARSLGIATVPQAGLANYAPFIRQHLGIDESRNLLVTIPFGYEASEHPANSYRTERAGIDDVARFHAH